MRTLLACAVLITCFTGCFRELVPVSGKWPEIKYPARPSIDIPANGASDKEMADAFIKATYQYSRHIDVLEAALNEYNHRAEDHNAAVISDLFGGQ